MARSNVSASYGDHRAACSNSGVLASRALPLERAVARVCQEAGARVGRNVALSAMNLDVPVHDARRIEVVCNGLNLWHGAQLAVDATLVSPVTREGLPQAGAATHPGSALRNAARRKRRQTYPELDRSRRCRLVVFGLKVGGRWDSEAATFVRLLARSAGCRHPRRAEGFCPGCLGPPVEWHHFRRCAERACGYLPRAPRPV